MLKYKMIEQKIGVGKDKGKIMQRVQAVARGKLTYKEFCRDVADGSTVDTADVLAVLEKSMSVLKRHLQNGYTIEFGDLGNFRLTYGSAAIPLTDKFDPAHQMRKPKIKFQPRKDFARFTDLHYECVPKSASKRKKESSAEEK